MQEDLESSRRPDVVTCRKVNVNSGHREERGFIAHGARCTLCRMRLGTVPYLNALPLLEGLSARADLQLVSDVPSRLAPRLRQGELDAALCSAVELFRQPPLTFLAGPAITSEGPVRSILLFLRTPPARIASLALDRSSRSAAALACTCLAEFFDVTRARVFECAPDAPLASIDADAILRIGDPALAAHCDGAAARAGRGTLDLGALWTERTALPFVYALWLVRPTLPAADAAALRATLLDARDAGLARREALAREFAARAGLPPDACADYLQRCIGFTLGEAEREGLAFFGRLAHRWGLVDSPLLPAPLA
jgi:chorismate dehydratase